MNAAETGSVTQPHRFLLSGDDLSPESVTRWLQLIDAFARHLAFQAVVFLDASCRPGDTEPSRWAHLRIEADPAGFPGRPGGHLVTLAGASALSRALLREFRQFHVRVDGHPDSLHPSWWIPSLEATEAEGDVGDPGSPDPRLAQASFAEMPLCSLLTSVFDGDAFLPGFLSNCARLDRYGDMEHWLVRPASPGQEHEALVDHVTRHPRAVYLRLAEDPGLYGVWNLCARLASAPYLSSANIDDRRAPAQVTTLVDLLERRPDIDVASTALRVTETPNLSWDDSADCPTWFGDGPNGAYGADQLMARREDGIVSRNIPHCMPVWRRSLHVRAGYFDERRYGPSADWEFWLRAGAQGTRFHLHREPLGLYLRSAQSYWRRGSGDDDFDDRIGTIHDRSEDEPRRSDDPRTASNRVRTMLSSRGCADWAHYLYTLQSLAREAGNGDALRTLLETLMSRDLGIDDGNGSLPPGTPEPARPKASPSLDEVLALIVESLHRNDAPQTGCDPARRNGMLHEALLQVYGLGRTTEAMLALAWLARRSARESDERRLLRAAHRDDPDRFWRNLQSAYRFKVPLDELHGVLDTPQDFFEFSRLRPFRRLYFFPDYRKGNPYQKLLYRSLQNGGKQVEPVRDLAALESGALFFEENDVLHLHWINGAYAGVAPGQLGEAVASFLEAVSSLKRRGMQVLWTVHNRYSHDFADRRLDRHFRERLSRQVDCLILHHPCLLSLFQAEWLHPDCPVSFLEHGPYRLSQRAGAGDHGMVLPDDIDAHRTVISIFGLIKPYKNLPALLPVIERSLAGNPGLQLRVAGRMDCEESRTALRRLSRERVHIEEGFVPEGELDRHYRATSFVLLSYRDILTSGSLFQAFSLGVPVIAPSLGSLPAYVVPGWNGFLYDSDEDLEGVLACVAGLSPAYIQSMKHNALTTAKSLSWPSLNREA